MKHKSMLFAIGMVVAQTLTMAIVALVVGPSTASAQYPPNHNFYPGRKCEINANVTMSNGVSTTSAGTMGMVVTGSSAAGEMTQWQTLIPTSFHSSGFDP